MVERQIPELASQVREDVRGFKCAQRSAAARERRF